MVRRLSYSESWLGLQRRRLATRVLAAVVAVLAALPFTAPFSACQLSVLLGASAHATITPAGASPALVSSDADRGYPTQSMLDEHPNDDAIPQESWVVDDGDGIFRVIVSLRVTPHASHVSPLVLRI